MHSFIFLMNYLFILKNHRHKQLEFFCGGEVDDFSNYLFVDWCVVLYVERKEGE